MSEVVLDASAVLAAANREPGAERVLTHAGRAVISSLNLAEVYAKLLGGGISEAAVSAGLSALVQRVIPLDQDSALTAARLHARTRSLGLSLADCVCLALGERLALPVLTTDAIWAKVELSVPVELIR